MLARNEGRWGPGAPRASNCSSPRYRLLLGDLGRVPLGLSFPTCKSPRLSKTSLSLSGGPVASLVLLRLPVETVGREGAGFPWVLETEDH